MRKVISHIQWLLLCFFGAQFSLAQDAENNNHSDPRSELQLKMKAYIHVRPEYAAEDFRMPVGYPNGNGYYNAQGFAKNDHLGDDWNGVGGGNTDLGDPVSTCEAGLVTQVYDAGPGWGLIVRVGHYSQVRDEFVESLYAHLNDTLVCQGEWVESGKQIGTIGNANGAYWAHLHFEIRSKLIMPLGAGYSGIREGYLDPTEYIKKF